MPTITSARLFYTIGPVTPIIGVERKQAFDELGPRRDLDEASSRSVEPSKPAQPPEQVLLGERG